MKLSFRTIAGAITAPRGFLAGGVFCDIKRRGTGKGSEKGQKRDLALLVSEVPAAVAGLFTTNQVCAAPVQVSLPRAMQAQARAIVANSGNANACTGSRGIRDAQVMTELAARKLALRADEVLVCSTGRIGVPMPMLNVRRGIESAVRDLGPTAAHGHRLAEAIMTSDTRPKEVAIEFKLGGKPVRVAGVCKGAGMIQPGMSLSGKRPAARPLHATMLAFITTDAAIESPALKAALAEATAQSFNRITVDGDMSTNDSVIALANGLAGNRPIGLPGPGRGARAALAAFQAALNHVTLELAKMIVRDGEGVSRLVTVRVTGAAHYRDADAAARAVANSALVKTSWSGGDPNWGRVMDALGYSSARIIEEKVDLGYSRPGSSQVRWAVRQGQPAKASFASLCRIAALPEFDLHIGLNVGSSAAVIYAADLTARYVEFNQGDVRDPASLGG
ncbi:MAG TPA: bifunctional glutamate N-acetyltransferase/amino-acid acetyltransferase ArgJ [Candidatus Paceibacterota bacterium]|nr:bifunctional glutamate N-acetyltransferase/amino-acid acetyltransferase ArgJ [Verrucomicrobiota bacterium]HRZ44932.1 bifunctional glutamate N-acetyltransferase/amino-acid acetyltransferase ArgJ [Candidatus Paceibacterota bacterium]HRZ93954.1 bifunctional glutamate N-acetyltransferase/amino-acid acetyltransferase ArgJ [Candidatus Paceibacterota bacterium]